jgi:hypothetical protein
MGINPFALLLSSSSLFSFLMKSFPNLLLTVLFLACGALTAAGAYEAQENFTLSPGDQPGGTKLTATPAHGRVYFFQMSTDGLNWGYCPTVKLGTTGTPLVYEVFPSVGQKYFYRLKYTLENNYTAGATGDVDSDGLPNSAELAAGTDPFNPDSDYDGIPDGWEVTYNLNPLLATDAEVDSDSPNGDTLTNLQEYRLGTDPTKKDTDGDGLNDNVEATNGGNPAKFDLPELYLEYAWREATAIDTRAYQANALRSVTGSISNSSESPGTAWSTTPPGGNTVVNVFSALNNMLGTQAGGTEISYSAWTPWPGGAIARFRQTFRGDGVATVNPMPIISHSFHRRDVKVRLRASRLMPVPWKIHLTQVRQSYTGKPGRAWESETVASNPIVLSIPKDQQESSYSMLIADPSDMANPGPPTAANPVNEFLVEYSLISNGTTVTPITSGPLKDQDEDGDGVTTPVEHLLDTSPTLYSTNNNGVGDSDAKVSGIRESYLTLLSHERSLYYSGSVQSATTTFAGTYSFNTTVQTDVIPGWPSLNGKLNAKGFPTTPPSDPFGMNTLLALVSRPPGTEYSIGNSDSTPPPGSAVGCIHADLAHKRSWGLLSIAPPANTTLNLLRVTSHTAKPNGRPVISADSVPLNFTAGNKRSTNYIDLIPNFTSTNGEFVKVSLLIPEVKPDANMAGVIGDTIPSKVSGSPVKHFVTPKKSTELPQDYVILKANGVTSAQMTPGHAQELLVWEVTPAGNRQTDNNPLHCLIKRGTAGRTVVKLKMKTGNSVLAETHVWVVWATGSAIDPTKVEAEFAQTFLVGGTYRIKLDETTIWRFKFTIEPSQLFDGTVLEIPKLDGASVIPPPGGEKLFAYAVAFKKPVKNTKRNFYEI